MKGKDVLIVGQGLAGTLLAFELHFAGVDVCIVDNPKKVRHHEWQQEW